MRILPAASDLTQPYWDGAREGKLLFQQCRDCNEAGGYVRSLDGTTCTYGCPSGQARCPRRSA